MLCCPAPGRSRSLVSAPSPDHGLPRPGAAAAGAGEAGRGSSHFSIITVSVSTGASCKHHLIHKFSTFTFEKPILQVRCDRDDPDRQCCWALNLLYTLTYYPNSDGTPRSKGKDLNVFVY